MTIETERERLVEASLPHVAFEGMNEAAIRAGAQDLGVDPALGRVYLPLGGADLAAAYHRKGDRALAEWMAATSHEGGIRDRIRQAVMHRIEATDRELARAGAAVLALPQNASLGAKLIWETADVIWNGLGDTSEDINWYSKRTTLGIVYSATALYWLGDDTPDLADTRAFLDRRLEGVMRFEKTKAMARKVPGVALITDFATGWIRKPGTRPVPGRWWAGARTHEASTREAGK